MKKKLTKGIIVFLMLLALTVCSVAFVACDDDEEPAGGTPVFTLDKTSITLTVDENVEVLTLTIANVDETPEWKVQDESVATVTVGATANKATVRGVSEGQTVVSVTAGDQIAVCTVKVNPGSHLELLTKKLELLVNRTGSVKVDTDLPSVTYTSDNTSVATVDQNGLVTGISAGTANIIVSGGNKQVSCPVTVTAPYVTLDKEIALLTLAEGENTVQLTADSNGDVEWSSDDEGIATVDANGLVTAVATGETVIRASYASAEAECVVKVKNEIITLTLNETEYTLEPGGSFDLTATLDPEQTGDDALITWSVVSGDDIVSVDENGRVTSLGEKIYGTAVVRATSNKDADAYAECTVTVPDPYGDWIKISDKETLINALKSENENKNMYLTGDIDLEGAVINSTLNSYYGILDGRGYEIMNFSGRLFENLSGTVENLIITYTAKTANEGICHHVNADGVIRNCRIEVTFGADVTGGIGCFVMGAVENTIILAHNSNGVGQAYAATVQNNMGKSKNVFYMVCEGNVIAGGATLKTEAQLKTPATFDGWDTDVWQIEEGEIPTLKNGGNIGEVKVELNETEVTIHNGDTFTLIATVKPAKLPAADKAVMWESSDESVVTVVDGVLTALKEGTATITVTSVKDPAKVVTCVVTVDAATVIELTSENSVTLEIGGQSQITATVNHGGLVYISSDAAIATVDENGKITAVSAGDAVITVKSEESVTVTKEISVTVMPEVQLSLKDGETAIDANTVIEIEIGEDKQITLVNSRPDDNGVWTSSNEEVATVEDGVVTGIKAGEEVVIRYTSSIDTNKYVTVKVTVMPEITVSAPERITIKLDGELKTLFGATVSRGRIRVESSDGETVKITEEDGKYYITGLKETTEEVTVTVTSLIDETKTAVCKVTVSNEVEVEVILNHSAANLDWEASLQLLATVNVGGVTWTSSDESIATVDENGLVTALRKDGEVTVTATSEEDGTKTATCVITVKYVAPVITVNIPDAATLENGAVLELRETLTVEFDVTQNAEKSIDAGTNGVLRVNGSIITAVTAGEATVRIVATKMGVETTVEFKVTVMAAPEVTITNKDVYKEGVKIGTESEYEALNATANRQDGTISWASSDETIATVDGNGAITTVGEGDVTITVTFTTQSGLTATDEIVITVYDLAILELTREARSVGINSSYAIEHKAAGGTVSWTSSNPAVATVDENGVVKGVSLGKTTITASIAGMSQTMIIATYEKAAGSTEISTAAQFKAIGAGTYYIVNNIDMDGDTVNTLNEWAKIDGLGYKVSNFKTPKLFTQLQGYIRNIEISCILNGKGNFDGLFGTWIGGADGTVENCIFDITFSGSANQCAFSHHNNNGKVHNVLLKVSREDGATGEKFPAWFERPNNGTVENMFVVVTGGSYSAVNGATQKTEAQLKQASTFDDSWDNGWVITDGEMPVLKGALVDEPLKIKLDKTTAEINVGREVTLTATVTPLGLPEDEGAYEWISENEEIATVADGVVHGLKAGTAVIKAVSTHDETVYATCTVTVNAITLTIDEEGKVALLKVGGTTQLGYTANDGDAVWSTSNAAVATVDENGLVTATGEGTVTVTVTSKLDPTVTDSITVTVRNSVEITVTLDKTEITLDREGKDTLNATVENSNLGVTWSVKEGADIVTVDPETGLVTALDKNGTATVVATANDDGGNGEYAYAECVVTVEYVAEEITLKTENSIRMAAGKSVTLNELATATKGAFTVELKDGEDGVVSIENGKVTATGKGSVTLLLTWSIAYDDIEDRTYEIAVEVFVPTINMSIDSGKRALKVGENTNARVLHVTLDNMPAEPAAEDVVWTSGNTDVVDTVTAGYSDGAYTGAINAKGEGLATITATYTDVEGNEYTITCDVVIFAGNATAVYNRATFTTAMTSGGNYYLAYDLDLGGATVTGMRGGYTGNFDGRGFTVSNFTTSAFFMYNQNGTIQNLSLVCTLDNNAGNEGILGHHVIGGTVKNCYFDITFGNTLAGVSPALANHIAGGTFENVIIVTHNPNNKQGTWADFFQTDNTVKNMISYRADSSIGAPRKGTNVTEAQFTSSSTYNESWDAAWIITDGMEPMLQLTGFPQEHRHVFSKEWTNDATNHWHAATCGDTDEVKDLGAHDTNGLEGECSVCGYLPEGAHRHTYGDTWLNDETNHWKLTTCEDHEEEAALLQAHDTKGVGQSCSVCGYVPHQQYDLVYSGENGMPSDKWVYWSGGNPCGGTFEDGTLTVEFSENAGDWWKTQLFYKDSAITNQAAAKITMTITSTVDGHITVNGKVVELKAGEAYTYTGNGNGGTALISIQMGVSSGNVIDIEAATIVFADITVTA